MTFRCSQFDLVEKVCYSFGGVTAEAKIDKHILQPETFSLALNQLIVHNALVFMVALLDMFFPLYCNVLGSKLNKKCGCIRDW